MLAVTLHLKETLNIGPDIRLAIVRTGGGEFRLGVEAPQDLQIWRGDGPPPPRPGAALPVELPVEIQAAA